jgi:hypothetical protein
MACQAFIDDDVFDKLCFVNEIWTQFLPQPGEGWVHIEFGTPML